MTEKNELLACPWCGEKPNSFSYRADQLTIECASAKCAIRPSCYFEGEKLEEFIDQWNTRASTPSHPSNGQKALTALDKITDALATAIERVDAYRKSYGSDLKTLCVMPNAKNCLELKSIIVAALQSPPEPTVDINVVLDALKPFARFAESLKQWNIGWHTNQEKHHDHKPVIRRTYPCDLETMRVCEVYPDDFYRAEQALSLLSGENRKDGGM